MALFITTSKINPTYPPEEQNRLINLEAVPGSQGWFLLNGKHVLPNTQGEGVLRAIHKTLHIGAKPLLHFLQPLFFHSSLPSVIKKITQECSICAQFSPQGDLRPPPSFSAHQLQGCIPGEDWQIDFTHMPAHKKLKYLLTLVDTFSGWVEAFPTTGESADIVSTHLINDIIPCIGLPWTLQSDNSPAFISKVTQIVSSTLGVAWNLHIPYHSQSSGKVERINRIIKKNLKKLPIELQLPGLSSCP
jgi:transposase InsO family protein